MPRLRFQGQNSDLHEHDLPAGVAAEAINVDVLTQPGVIQARPGLTRGASAFTGAPVNIFYFHRPDGTETLVGKVTDVLEVGIGSGPSNLGTTFFSNNEPGSFWYSDGRMYYSDETLGVFWDFNDAKLYRLGLPKPSQAFTVAGNTLGAKHGGYRVAVAYEDTDRRVVGHRSNASSVIQCDQYTIGEYKGVAVSLLVNVISSQLENAVVPYKADKVQILVTKALFTVVNEAGDEHTSDPGYYWYEQRIAKATATVIGLIKSDESLPPTQLHLGAGGQPPLANIAGVIDGIGFYLNDDKPMYSLPGRPEMISDENEIADNLVLDPHIPKTEFTTNLPGRPIAVAYAGNAAIVFTESGAGRITRIADRLGLAPLAGVPGTYGPMSLAQFAGGLVYFSGKTLYVLSGASTQQPGVNLFQRVFDTITAANRDDVVVGHYSAESQIWVAYATGGATNKRILIYDYLRDQVQIFDAGGASLSIVGLFERFGANAGMWAVNVNGYLYQLDTGNRGVDNTGSAVGISQTKWRGSLMGPDLSRQKRITRFDVLTGTLGGDITLTLTATVTKEATPVPSPATTRVLTSADSDKSVSVQEFIGLVGNYFELTVEADADSEYNWKITGIEWDAEAETDSRW